MTHEEQLDEFVRQYPRSEWPIDRSVLEALDGEVPMPDLEDHRDGDLLLEALRITTGPRANRYGHASENLSRTAAMMDAYLDGIDRKLTPSDVSALMIIVKLARLHRSPDHYDTLLDAAGWASAGWDAVAALERDL